MDAGIAEVDPDRVGAVGLDDRRQAPGDLLKRLVPGRGAQLAVAAHKRRAQAVGILLQRAQAGALGADEALGEDVVAVAADLLEPAVLVERQLEAAGRLTQGAGRVGGPRGARRRRRVRCRRRRCSRSGPWRRSLPAGCRPRQRSRRRVDPPRVTFYPLWRWPPPHCPFPTSAPPPSAPRASSRPPPAAVKDAALQAIAAALVARTDEILEANARDLAGGRAGRALQRAAGPAHADPGADRSDGRGRAHDRRAARSGRARSSTDRAWPTASTCARSGSRSASSPSSTRRGPTSPSMRPPCA